MNPSGYLRGLRAALFGMTTTGLSREDDEPYDPADDAPFTVFEHVQLVDPTSPGKASVAAQGPFIPAPSLRRTMADQPGGYLTQEALHAALDQAWTRPCGCGTDPYVFGHVTLS
jgi:hypothetical protein